MRAFVKTRDYIITRGKILKGYNLANIRRKSWMDTIFRVETPHSFIWNYQFYILSAFYNLKKFQNLTLLTMVGG